MQADRIEIAATKTELGPKPYLAHSTVSFEKLAEQLIQLPSNEYENSPAVVAA